MSTPTGEEGPGSRTPGWWKPDPDEAWKWWHGLSPHQDLAQGPALRPAAAPEEEPAAAPDEEVELLARDEARGHAPADELVQVQMEAPESAHPDRAVWI